MLSSIVLPLKAIVLTKEVSEKGSKFERKRKKKKDRNEQDEPKAKNLVHP